MDPNMYVTISG